MSTPALEKTAALEDANRTEQIGDAYEDMVCHAYAMEAAAKQFLAALQEYTIPCIRDDVASRAEFGRERVEKELRHRKLIEEWSNLKP